MSKKNITKFVLILIAISLSIAVVSIIIVKYFNNKKIETAIYDEKITKMLYENEENNDIITVSADEKEQLGNQDNENFKADNKDTNTQPKISTTSNYYIKVNYQANVVTIYKMDTNGENIPIKAMVCSCGTATPTEGIYKTTDKYTWRLLFGGVYGQYATRIVGSILFHSVPYQKQSKDSLEYWEYDKLGQTASAGCVRLTVADAKWIYDNCPKGTQVEFYASSDPGPLGKPSAAIISNNTKCRNWDPTDDSKENPWKLIKEENKIENITNKI